MNKLWPTLIILMLGVTRAQASLHLVSLETFRGVGTVNSSNPENLTSIEGNFYKRAVGPKLIGDKTANGLGWSADLDNTVAFSTVTLPVPSTTASPSADTQCFDCWVYVHSYYPSSTADTQIAALYAPDNNVPFCCMSLGFVPGAFNLTTYKYYGAPTTSVPLKLNTWYELRLAWTLEAFYSYNISVLYRAAGSKKFSTLYNYTNISIGNYFGSLLVGSSCPFGTTSFNGRIGMPSLYNLDLFSNKTDLVTDVIDPPSGPFNWYVNPVTGNDNNDGTTPGTAWHTVTKINAESANCGMFPSTSGYAKGDTLNINGATGPGAGLVLGTESLNLNTQGLNLIGHDSPYSYIQAEEVMTEHWTLVSGSKTVWQCQVSSGGASCVVWEDDKWLNHPTGTSFAGAIQTAMEATPGSYWSNLNTIYYRPFGDTNPNTDGKVKTRSYNRNYEGDSAILMLAPELNIQGIRCRKTALADRVTNDPINAYCLQSLGILNGASLIKNCYFDYGSKHIMGFTDISTNRTFTVQNVTVDQCQPYAGGIPLVDYCQLDNILNNTTTYSYVSNPHVLGLIGSTRGDPTNGDNATWYSHSGGAGQFSNISFLGCNFAGYITSTVAETYMTIRSTTCGAIISDLAAGGEMTVDRSKVTAAGITCGTASSQTYVTNSIIAPTETPYNGGEFQLYGNISFKGCTFDLTKILAGYESAFYTRIGPLNFTMQNCVVLLNQKNTGFGFLADVTSGDTLLLDHNLYQTGGNSSAILTFYNNGNTTSDLSLQQMQAINLEQSSSHDETPHLNGDYLPQPNSPAILAGVNLNPPINTDYTGTIFTVRSTIGAREPATPEIYSQPVAQVVGIGQSVIFSAGCTEPSGIGYQWLKNGVTIPGQMASTFTIPSVAATDAGNYSVRLTNRYGTLVSNTAALTVTN